MTLICGLVGHRAQCQELGQVTGWSKVSVLHTACTQAIPKESEKPTLTEGTPVPLLLVTLGDACYNTHETLKEWNWTSLTKP